MATGECESVRRPSAIFLMGPTAAGKTDLAVELCQRFPCEIISVDSALVYRGMDIGTAKPGPDILDRAPHRLIDIRDPSESYSVGEFYRDALAAMEEITQKGKVPLLVGGTMMYFKALRDGLGDLPQADAAVRARLEAELQAQGNDALYRRLQQLDPEAARRIHPHNRQRLLRALEVYEVTGRPISSFWQGTGGETQSGAGSTNNDPLTNWERESFAGIDYNIINLAVAPACRQELHRRIELRFRQMLAEGLVEEVQKLHQRGDLGPDLPAIRSVGYRQVWDYLDGVLDYSEMVMKGIAATRQLAKRQLTWLRRWPSLTWLETEDAAILDKATGSLSSVFADKPSGD